MAKRGFIRRALIATLAAASLAPAAGAEDYYAGKTIQLIVGLAPGGGFDTYARLIARHMGKHIPGNPSFVVMNMPGAGSMKAVNYLAGIAKPDGLTIGTFLGHVVWSQVYSRPGVQFDARQLIWLGIPAARTGSCVMSKASGIADMQAWKAARQPVPLAAAGVATESYNTGRILKDVLELPIHLVPAYSGSQPIRLAIENGEVSGVCLQWEAISASWKHALENREIFPVLQFRRTPHPELPNVPMAVSFAKNDDDRELLTAGVEHSNAITTSYALPPGTPGDKAAILRKAFLATINDPAARAEAALMSLDMDAIDGEATQKMIGELFTLKPGVKARLQDILYGNN